MSERKAESSRFRWAWVRHVVQVGVLFTFCLPVLISGWGLFGLYTGGDDAIATPADLPFFGSLSSSTIFGLELMDPYALLQVVAASLTFEVEWLIAALPVLLVYGLVRGRAFCGWICPVNLVLECVDGIRKKLNIQVKETPIPRRAKIVIALAVVVLSGVISVPIFEAFSPISTLNKGIIFGSVTGSVILGSIVLIELFWGHRVWCRSLCPLGGFYEALGRIGQVNIKIDAQACVHCDACKAACLCDPEVLEPALRGDDAIVRAGDCMACGSCIDACPTKALGFSLGRSRQQD